MSTEVFKFGNKTVELNIVEMQQIKERYEQICLVEYLTENYNVDKHNVEKLASEIMDYKNKYFEDESEGNAIYEVLAKHSIKV